MSYNDFMILENVNNKLPVILYHATPSANLDGILKNGLKPKLDNHTIGGGEIHEDRIFLSIYNNPYNMNLPIDKINSDLKMLKISTNGLDKEDFYPDDSLYWAYYNDQLSDDDLSILFPELYKKYIIEDNYDDFGEWLIEKEHDVTDEEFDKFLKGKFYLTLPNSNIMGSYDAGEIAYKGIIPPENILSTE